jgi:hypothetical protein
LKPEIKFGFLASIILVFVTLSQYLLGFHTINLSLGHYTNYVIYLIVFVALFLSLKEKKADYGGILTVRKGIKSGLFQLMITAIPASLFLFFYSYKINPLWVERLIDWQRSHHAFFSALKFIANDPNATTIILSNTEVYLCLYFLSILFFGGIFTFLITLFLMSSFNKSKLII